MEDLYEEVGFNFIYHYNPFNKLHYCIAREDYVNYWNGLEEDSSLGWTSGKTIEEAQRAMIEKIKEEE